MNLLTPALVFPFSECLVPIIRHIDCGHIPYSINAVLDWRGHSLIGKDIATIHNHPPIGVEVLDQSNYEKITWRTLIVDCQNAHNDYAALDKKSLYCRTLEDGKQIIFMGDAADSDGNYISSLAKTYPNQVQHITFEELQYAPLIQSNKQHSFLSVPVILVGGAISCQDSLEVILSLKERFCVDGYRVSCLIRSDIGLILGLNSFSHIFNGNTLSESDRILQLNQLAAKIINAERPDLLLVEAPDAVLKFNSIRPNGYGVRTYMMSQALEPDGFICCMPCEMVSKNSLDAFNKSLLLKYGFSASAIHATNEVVDGIALEQDQTVSCVHIPVDEVSRILSSMPDDFPVPVVNVIVQGIEEIYQSICCELK